MACRVDFAGVIGIIYGDTEVAMFLRVQRNDSREYLLIVENERINGRVRQRVLHRLGRLDVLQQSGALDGLIESMSRFSDKFAVLAAHRDGQAETGAAVTLGPAMVFERLWQQLHLPAILDQLLAGRRFEFAVERAVFLTVLHRLCAPGSDRAAEQWRQDHRIEATETLALHHLYRAMAWLGEPLPGGEQLDATLPQKTPRCIKDVIEERLFERRRDLLTDLSLAFFDTTSIYFEGKGGQTIGEYGFSKDHRPDRKQMVVGVVLAQDGTPICSEQWPGNVSDVTTLLPVIRRLRDRFGISRVCIVADRGMISARTIQQIEQKHPDLKYILGARMRSDHEVRDVVLNCPSPFRQVRGPRTKSKDPSPLDVQDVRLTDDNGQPRRYIVCHNPEQAKKDQADREAMVAALEDKVKHNPKALMGNKGYRRYVKAGGQRMQIDYQKVQDEARFDGKWVLRTNWHEADAEEVALRYKDLWMVEAIFRTTKSILQMRPIYHRCDETIRGHVFCSFLALVLRKALQDRLSAAGAKPEWAELMRDLEAIEEMPLRLGSKRYLLRTPARGAAAKALSACGLAPPPTLRELTE
jgi:transposase